MLFDNCIGRKRDVGGVVLAPVRCLRAMGWEKTTTTVTFETFGFERRVGFERREMVEIMNALEQMCLELVKSIRFIL